MNRIHLATNLTATAIAASLISLSLASTSFADTPKKESSAKSQTVVQDQAGTSQEEIATVDVLNDICPKILGTNNNKNFQKGYSILITSMLPSIKYPVLAVQAMHTDPDYMKTYNDAHAKALQASDADNREVCLEVLHYKADQS